MAQLVKANNHKNDAAHHKGGSMATTMSVKEVAAELGLSVPTVWRLVRRRELGHAKCGRRVLVPSEEIQRFLRARFTPAAEAGVGSRSRIAK